MRKKDYYYNPKVGGLSAPKPDVPDQKGQAEILANPLIYKKIVGVAST